MNITSVKIPHTKNSGHNFPILFMSKESVVVLKLRKEAQLMFLVKVKCDPRLTKVFPKRLFNVCSLLLCPVGGVMNLP